jgi:hypothetical protein
MPEYVAYHSEAVMGRAFVPQDSRFTFLSNKPVAVLRRAIGQRVWVVSGASAGRRTEYRLVGFYFPDDVRATSEAVKISGWGTAFSPAPTVTNQPWFVEMRREQANFSLGFSPLRSEYVIQELDRLVAQLPPSDTGRLPEEVPERVFREGRAIQVPLTRYERDKGARDECLRVHGTTCVVCRIDHQSLYGPIAEALVQVHHLTPISSLGREYVLEPSRDLVPVCPNCHAVIHRHDPPLTPDEVVVLIQKARAG